MKAIMKRAHEIAREMEGHYSARLAEGLRMAWVESRNGEKIDLLNAKMWAPKPELARFYFGEKYLQCSVAKNGKVYYKVVGIEKIENIDEVVSQISYFMNVETNEIFASKF